MLKYLLFSLLFFSFLIVNAQVEQGSKAIIVTVGLENNRQLYSNSDEKEGFTASIFSSKFSDGYERELVVGIGSTTILEDDNFQSWSIFGSGSSWDRNDVFDSVDSSNVVQGEISVFAGKVKSYSIGLRYTYGLSLTHRENLNFLLGFRGELHENYHAAAATEGVGFDRTINQISLRTFIVPELQYVVPNTRYMLSLRMGLPVASFGFETETVKNPALIANQQKSSGVYFDNFRLKEHVFEVSFGYFLKS